LVPVPPLPIPSIPETPGAILAVPLNDAAAELAKFT